MRNCASEVWSFNLAASDGDMHRVSIGIVGYVGHGFGLAFRSNIILIT